MPFQKGDLSVDRTGRPVGSATRVGLNKIERRIVIKQLAQRAKAGDNTATDALALIMIQGATA